MSNGVPLETWNGSSNVVRKLEILDRKNSKLQYLIIFLTVISIFAALSPSWLEWQTREIKGSCALTAADFPKESQEDFYRNCVRQNGISPD